MVFDFNSLNSQEFFQALDSSMDEVADRIFAKSQNIIVDKNIIDEGTLLKSGTIKRDFLSKEIIYAVPYAESIEFGRTPGTMPPIQPIKEWVKRKGLAKNDSEASRIAFLIARDIKINGVLPRPFLSPAVDSVKAQLN